MALLHVSGLVVVRHVLGVYNLIVICICVTRPTMYTTIPHGKLEKNHYSMICWAFVNKRGDNICSYNSIFKATGQLVQNESRCHMKVTEKTVYKMLDLLIDNMYVKVGDRTFRQK